MQKPKILFICTANLNRSKTAEGLFRDKYPVKSAGTLCIKDDGYTTPVGLELLEWADLVIVFESDHVECQSKTYHYQSQTGSMLAYGSGRFFRTVEILFQPQ